MSSAHAGHSVTKAIKYVHIQNEHISIYPGYRLFGHSSKYVLTLIIEDLLTKRQPKTIVTTEVSVVIDS